MADVVLLGAMAQMPVAGVAWQVLHYLEGLRRLGHRVLYLEETGSWPYDPVAETVTDDAGPAAARLAALLAPVVGDDWAFVNAARPGEVAGVGARAAADRVARADVLINLSGATPLTAAHRAVPVRIYLETDPVRPQIELDQGNAYTRDLLGSHTHHATYGERIGRADCVLPTGPFRFRPTRQPVVLDWWAAPLPRAGGPGGRPRFTTVASWRQPQKDVVWRGEHYGWSKEPEFRKLDGLPARAPADLELALALPPGDPAAGELRALGWRVTDAAPLSRDPGAYRDHIHAADGEFTVAKDQNVRLRSGWFSDRTATYLASGRPAVVQDTGFDVSLPVGEGLLAFRTEDEALAALEEVCGDLPRHARAARAVAECFRAEDVCAELLAGAGV